MPPPPPTEPLGLLLRVLVGLPEAVADLLLVREGVPEAVAVGERVPPPPAAEPPEEAVADLVLVREGELEAVAVGERVPPPPPTAEPLGLLLRVLVTLREAV